MIQDEQGREYLTAQEASEVLNLSRSAFYAFVKRKSLKRYGPERGRNRYFLKADIDAWASKLDKIVLIDEKGSN